MEGRNSNFILVRLSEMGWRVVKGSQKIGDRKNECTNVNFEDRIWM